MRWPALVLLAISADAFAADNAPFVGGLWIDHDQWELAPPEINEYGGIHKSAGAAVVNFCPHGEFRMATGVIYQSTSSPRVGIGASDGLAIYLGRWSKTGDTVSVEYRLVSAEFADLLDDPGARQTHIGKLLPAKGRLLFPFTSISGKIWQLNLLPAARYEKKVQNWFVECAPKPR